MGVSFIANVVLARLLTPSDFGAIGMLAIFVSISTTFIDGGFGSALIQKKEPTQTDYSTIFYINIVVSVLLYLLLYVSAPYIAEFYHMEILKNVLRVLGLILIINAFSIIQANRLRKNLQFKKLSVVSLASITISTIIAIFMAYRGYGVWSLVWMQIINGGVSTLLLWIYGKWAPSKCFSYDSVKQLFGFGSFLLISNLINNTCNNIQGLIIGRMFSSAIMGYYSQARKLEEIPSTSISTIIDKVSYPVMSAHQNNPTQLISFVRKFIALLAFLTFPTMLLLIIIAKPLVVLLFSGKWVECAPYFQILCLGGIAICLQSINYYAVAAIGRSKALFKWTVIKRGIALLLLFAGCLFGIYGLLIGAAMGCWVIYFCNSYLVSVFLNFSIRQQLRDLFPILLISAVSFAIAYIPRLIFDSEMYILQAVLFVAAYIGISYKFDNGTLTNLKQLVNNIRSNDKGL